MKQAVICVCISGFTQTRGSYHGILALREKLIASGHSFGVANRVWYLPWTTNWKRIANDLSIIGNRHGFKPEMLIAGYSYGGWGSIQLARHLERVGIYVQVMVLSDPVARPWFWPRPLPALTSLLSRDYSFALQIPNNVINLYEYYQTNDRPQGHRLIIGNGTSLGGSCKLNRVHQRMDDAPEFHGCVLKMADALREMCEENEETVR